jgi:ATP-dependent DNA helicase
MYHGSPEERADLRKTVMALPDSKTALKPKKPVVKKATKTKKRSTKGRKSKKAKEADEDDDEEDSPVVDDQVFNDDFPVVITTYEMIIRDRAHLAKYSWGYIVVDEGHRLKNLNCKLMKEIAKYHSACRMILTGTPLHVRLSSNCTLALLIALPEQPVRALVPSPLRAA